MSPRAPASTLALLLLLLPGIACVGETAAPVLPPPTAEALALDGTQVLMLPVEASCGQCQFGLNSAEGPSGCDLAVRMDGVALFVQGTGIDDHGDSHADDGFCNAIRGAEVTGTVEGGRLVVSEFRLTDD